MLVVAIYSQQLHHQLWKLLVDMHIMRSKNQRPGNSYLGIRLAHPNVIKYTCYDFTGLYQGSHRVLKQLLQVTFHSCKTDSLSSMSLFLSKIKNLWLYVFFFILKTSDEQLNFSPSTDLSKSAFCRSWDNIKVIADVQRARHWKQSMNKNFNTRCTLYGAGTCTQQVPICWNAPYFLKVFM